MWWRWTICAKSFTSASMVDVYNYIIWVFNILTFIYPLPVHSKLDDFFNNPLESLLPRSPPQSININNSLVTATSILTVVIKDAPIIMQQAAKTQRGCDNVMSKVQALFLFASLTNCSNPADSSSDPLKKVLDVKGTSTAVHCLELLFMHRFSCQFSPLVPLITNIRAGSFSNAPGQGGGICIFYFFNLSNSLSSQHDMAALQTKQQKEQDYR